MARDGDERRGGGGRTGRPDWRERERAARVRGAVLDVSLQPAQGPRAHTTVYEPDVLLVRPDFFAVDETGRRGDERLAELAQALGWSVSPERLEDAVGARPGARPAPPQQAQGERPEAPRGPARAGIADSSRMRITVAAGAARDGRPVHAPDAWRLLVAARDDGIRGLALNHVLGIHPFTGNPFTGNPFTGNPFTGNPFTGNPFTGNPFTGNPFTGNPAGLASYAYPGFGGRTPVAWTGPAPLRTPLPAGARRPVIAVLDTGCGAHPWFGNLPGAAPGADPVLIHRTTHSGEPLGLDDPATDPETHPSLTDPLDGRLDPVAGHGTFIAGLVLQACPEAQILPVRVSDGNGTIMENDLLGALGRIVELLESGALHLDVMTLSFGFFHESPGAEETLSELYGLLRRVRGAGCVVVCSAGNDATDRPSSPAALFAWGAESGIDPEDEKDLAPQVSVGALNPSGRSVALFSNIGPWVRTYAVGVSVLSTLPVAFDGGTQAGTREDAEDRRRETLDLDDFAGGFAVWSGTSFAAPVVAGRIARELGSGAPAVRTPSTIADAVRTVLDRCAREDASRT
ncbi:S8 family serine peptidase [Microbacterium azadirachtae]|uniref:S8 family peptidase n=1 Tax=Microbacterium azadirachtae TaxID=582680 RepID=UPI0021D4E902|nr:S8 family serine peptidase [Microbacterium azadirachtae]UXW84932.1 S8 family serine peptidase [Microbacterium azadirachtae]